MGKVFIQELDGDMDIKEKINNRWICNSILLECIKLKNYLYGKHLRFIQSLWALGFINNEDKFYEEPYDTIKNNISKIIDLVNDSNISTISEKIIKNNIIYYLNSIKINLILNEEEIYVLNNNNGQTVDK